MRIALFGGTFDPVHNGHLAVARAARQRLGLDAVHFIPADLPPHKLDQAITAYQHRFAMLDLALADEPGFLPSRIEELPEGGTPAPNFTIDTVRRFKEQTGEGAEIFLILGIDTFLQLATWRQPAELARESEFIVVSRPGFDMTALDTFLTKLGTMNIAIERGRLHLLEDVRVDVSATALRQAARQGEPLDAMVPAEVAAYIREHRLYG